jgi:nucleoside-diphosphate-sugar epimerase
MHVLLTGGLGVNGAWVLRSLRARGDSVTVFENRLDTSLVADLAGELDLVEGDVTDQAALAAALARKPADAIVHMAAVLYATDNPVAAKSPSTPPDFGSGLLNVIDELARSAEVSTDVDTRASVIGGKSK